jgi:tRNA nucleotidyltransferase/poly(A) polymerase
LNGNFLLDSLLDLRPANARLYLVGGAVRDILLQKPGRDFDLVCDFDPRNIARPFANLQKGAYYLLDSQRNTCRVILYEQNGRRVFYDFARMQGDELEIDLSRRDFTINAMAIDLQSPKKIIDPLGGAADLKEKVLRACSDSSFADDPVRVIRAVRYAVALNLAIDPRTLDALKAAVPLLSRISRERTRDELLKVLDSGRPDVGLRLLSRLDILNEAQMGTLESEISKAAARCGALEALFAELEGIGTRESAQVMPMAAYLLRLGRFKDPCLAYLHSANDSARTRRVLDLLLAWISDYPQAEFAQVLEVLSLSNDENEHLHRMRDFRILLEELDGVPDRRQIYRFFKRTTIDSCFIWLADLLSAPPTVNSSQAWLKALGKCEVLMDAWVNQPEVLSPIQVLTGTEIMQMFNMPPGANLGKILVEVLEDQAAGTVNTRTKAVQWLQSQIIH